MSYKYQGKKFLSLPEQVEVNKRNIEQLKRDKYQTFTTLLAIENLTYLQLNQLVENSRDVYVGDLIYGSDAYYGQVTRVGGSVVEFTTVGMMPAGPKGDQGPQGPQGPQGEYDYTLWTGSQTEYDSLSEKDENTLYFIEEE